jgi:FkbM family methyltransferase
MNSQRLKNVLRRALNSAGLDVRWHVERPPHALQTLLDLYRVDTVFDIGANAGMSGQYFRNIGFRGTIVSFEPVRRYYHELERKAAKDSRWFCENVAVGDSEGELEINVSGASGATSSFLEMTPAVTKNEPALAFVDREHVRVTTVDALARDHYPRGDRLFLKLDVQGYERKVLAGARQTLDRIVGLRIELSILKCYEDEPLLCEMLPYLQSLGFALAGIEPAWSDPRTQEVFQLDGMFVRTDRLR